MPRDRGLTTTIVINGNVDDSVREAFEQAVRRIDNLREQTQKSAKASKALSDGYTVAKNVLANLVTSGIQKAVSGLQNLAGSAVDTGMDFSSTMAEVQALSGATGDELQRLEDTAREYGKSTVFSASESAAALKYMALAGWDVEQSTSALGGVLDLAAASGMDLAAASDMVTDYMSAFGMEAEKSAYFADILAYAQANSNTSAEQLGEAYKNAAANMNAAGQDIETTTSLLAMMANQGLKGSEAGTALTAVMRDMTAKMKDGAIKIGDTSIAVMDAQGNYRDLTDILSDVQRATNKMGDAERAMALSSTFTSDSIKGLNLMLNAGIDNAADFERQLRKSGGSAGDMADVMNDTLTGDLKEMQSGFDELKLKIFDGLEGPMRTVIQFVTSTVIPKIEEILPKIEPIFQACADNIGPLLDSVVNFTENGIEFLKNNIDWLIPVVAGLTAAFAAYKAITAAVAIAEVIKTAVLATGATTVTAATVATWALDGALAVLTSPITIVIAAIAALVAAVIWLYRNWDTAKQKIEEFGAKVDEIWTNISNWITGAIDKIGQHFPLFGAYLSSWWQSIQSVIENVKGIFKGIIDFVKNVFAGNWKDAWSNVIDIFKNIFGMLMNISKAPLNAVISIVNKAISGINGIGFTIPDWVPLLGGKKFAINIPQIPMLASGGFTNGVSIAGEAGTEAVLSFNPAYRDDNIGYWAKAGRMLGATAEDAGFSLAGTSGGTVVDMGGVTFAPNITIGGKADKESVVKAIEDEYPEFLDMLERWLFERGLPVNG